MDEDEFGAIFNGPNTFWGLAKELLEHRSTIFAWKDELGTMYTILLAIDPPRASTGALSSGLNSSSDLFIGVAGRGFFGFDRRYTLDGGYVGEKLKINATGTANKLAELIMGVRNILQNAPAQK